MGQDYTHLVVMVLIYRNLCGNIPGNLSCTPRTQSNLSISYQKKQGILSTWDFDEDIPDAGASSILVGHAFDLLGRSGGAKHKAILEALTAQTIGVQAGQPDVRVHIGVSRKDHAQKNENTLEEMMKQMCHCQITKIIRPPSRISFTRLRYKENHKTESLRSPSTRLWTIS